MQIAHCLATRECKGFLLGQLLGVIRDRLTVYSQAVNEFSWLLSAIYPKLLSSQISTKLLPISILSVTRVCYICSGGGYCLCWRRVIRV